MSKTSMHFIFGLLLLSFAYDDSAGQISAKDFIKFEEDPYTLFLSDLPEMYKN